MRIYHCPSPELYPLYHRAGAAVVIIDIFRATTTIATALAHGARALRPVASVEEAEQASADPELLIAGERNIHRLPFAHLGNSPEEYTPERVAGKTIVLTTTNGTRTLDIARQHGAPLILTGAHVNLEATLRYLASVVEEVVLVGAGWKGQVSLEDSLFAGAFAHRAELLGLGQAADDMSLLLRDLWQEHCSTAEAALRYHQQSEHYARFVAAGIEHCAAYCLTPDLFDMVVRLEGDELHAFTPTHI